MSIASYGILKDTKFYLAYNLMDYTPLLLIYFIASDEKRRLRGHMIALFKYLKCCHTEEGQDLFSIIDFVIYLLL